MLRLQNRIKDFYPTTDVQNKHPNKSFLKVRILKGSTPFDIFDKLKLGCEEMLKEMDQNLLSFP